MYIRKFAVYTGKKHTHLLVHVDVLYIIIIYILHVCIHAKWVEIILNNILEKSLQCRKVCNPASLVSVMCMSVEIWRLAVILPMITITLLIARYVSAVRMTMNGK